jgi:hypothetical protein
MATERLSMRQIREILRQKWCLGQSHRAVAESLGIGCATVGTTVLRARAAGLEWTQVERLTDEVLEARVYGPPTPPTHHRVVPDCAYLHAERRKPGVTLELPAAGAVQAHRARVQAFQQLGDARVERGEGEEARGSLWHPVDHHHQPTAPDSVPRLHRRADPRRFHL